MKSEETLRCRVVAHNFSPRGGVEGLLVEAVGRPAQIVFLPEKGTELSRTIAIGQTVDLVVEAEPPAPKGEASHPVYRFVSTAPSEKSRGAVTPPPNAIKGVVARLNYARHGEPNGVVLDTGDFIHLKPDGMKQLKLKVGDHIEADGETHPMDLGGHVVEAKSVNGVQLKGMH